jgi:hypothetical protein
MRRGSVTSWRRWSAWMFSSSSVLMPGTMRRYWCCPPPTHTCFQAHCSRHSDLPPPPPCPAQRRPRLTCCFACATRIRLKSTQTCVFRARPLSRIAWGRVGLSGRQGRQPVRRWWGVSLGGWLGGRESALASCPRAHLRRRWT